MNIGVIGHIGNNNFGDDIILSSLINIVLNKIGPNDLKLHVFYGHEKPDLSIGHDNLYFHKQGISSYLTMSTNLDVLIKCGGSSLHDSHRRLKYFLISLSWLVLFMYYKIFGTKIYQISIGVGPINTYPLAILAYLTMGMSDVVTTRDHLSYEISAQYPIAKNNLCESTDLSLPYLYENIPEHRFASNKSYCLGVCPISYFRLYHNDRQLDEQRYSHLASLIDKNADIAQVRILVFNTEHDLQVAKYLERRLKTKSSLTTYGGIPIEFAKQVEGVDGCICTRYHSHLIAYARGIPMISVPYHDKCVQFTSECSLDNYYLLEKAYGRCLRDVNVDGVSEDVLNNFVCLGNTNYIGRDDDILRKADEIDHLLGRCFE